MEKFTEKETKVLDMVVSVEQQIAELKSQLIQEMKDKLAAQEQRGELESMGVQMGKGLTEIIEELTSDLLKEDEGGQDGDGDMEVLRRNIPIVLNTLKENIRPSDFDKEVMEDFKKLINNFILAKKSKLEETPVVDQPVVMDCEDNIQTTSIFQYVPPDVYNEIKNEIEEPQASAIENSMVDLDPPPPLEIPPIQPPPEVPPFLLPEVTPSQPIVVPIQLDSDSEDDDVVFLEEREAPQSERDIPLIVSTYSVPSIIRGQFTTPGSDNEPSDYEDDDAIPIPSTCYSTHSKTRRRCIAMKRTGGFGFMPRFPPLEYQMCPVRRSPRLSKPTPKMLEQIIKKERKPKLTYGDGRQQDSDLTKKYVGFGYKGLYGKPKKEKVSKMKKTMAMKNQQHYLVDTRKGSDGFRCVCGHHSNYKTNINTHIRTLTEEFKFKCRICQKPYFYHAALKSHLKTHKAVPDPENNLYGCSYCGMTFSSKEQFYEHRTTCSFIIGGTQSGRGRGRFRK